MKRIEFVGTQYVGKSTLFKEVSKKIKRSPQLKNKIVYDKLFAKDLLLKKFFSVLMKFAFSPNTFQICLQQNSNWFNDKGLQLLISEDAKTYINDSSFQLRILNKLNNLLNRLDYHVKYHKNEILIVEEFILHWNFVLIDMVRFGYKIEESTLHQSNFLCPDGIILCFTPQQTLQNRITTRINNGGINKRDKDLSFKEILEKCIERQDAHIKIAEYFEETRKIPVLKINTSEPLSYNQDIIIEFIENNF